MQAPQRFRFNQVSDASVSQRATGALWLAIIALVSVLRLRSTCESTLSLVMELGLQASIFLASGILHRQRMRTDSYGERRAEAGSIWLAVTGAALTPFVLQLLLRAVGHGTGLELVAMSSFGWANLLATIGNPHTRHRGLSVVCSGFLTLLATFSSDQSSALLLAFLWGVVCLWWLASSQWERALHCQVSTVQQSPWQRVSIVGLGCVVFALAALSVSGRIPTAQRLSWNLMPTSGGNEANDQFARSGVGDGDAVVAAREHAASFGAVDSDVLLDSKESSLFDLFSDAFGEPVRKSDTERTVALAPQEQASAERGQMAQSDGASSSLTTQRRASKPPSALESKPSDALLFWIGRPDMRLALQRFSQFDGLEWKAAPGLSAHSTSTRSEDDKKILPIPHTGQTWFSVEPAPAPFPTAHKVYCGACSEAVKFARLRTPSIPTVSSMESWHIHQVEDSSFFRIDCHDNLTMVGRKSVPEYTVVRYVNRETNLEALVGSINNQPTKASSLELPTRGQQMARDLAVQWSRSLKRPTQWEVVQAITDRLRKEFRLEKERDTSQSLDPLADFLTQRAGNELMFATAAAVMLRELGFQTRLVTGFLARRENRLNWTKELAIYDRDTHAWIELQTAGAWVPFEPSPGYPLPIYYLTWRYWLWMNAWRLGFIGLSVVGGYALAYWQRGFIFDMGCQALALLWFTTNDQQRCRLLLLILDLRSKLAGNKRPEHITPGRWYRFLTRAPELQGSRTISESTEIFFREVDRMWFGHQTQLSPNGKDACRVLWTKASCRLMRCVFSSSSSSPTLQGARTDVH